VSARRGAPIRPALSPGRLGSMDSTSQGGDAVAELSERAWELVVRSLVRLGWLGGCLPPLCPAVAGPTVGEEGGDGSDRS